MRIETLTRGEVKPPSRSHTTEKGGAPGFRPKSVRLQNVVASSRGGDGPSTPHAFAHSLTVPSAPGVRLGFWLCVRAAACFGGHQGCECVCAGGRSCERTHSLQLDLRFLGEPSFLCMSPTVMPQVVMVQTEDSGKRPDSGSFWDRATGAVKSAAYPQVRMEVAAAGRSGSGSRWACGELWSGVGAGACFPWPWSPRHGPLAVRRPRTCARPR